MSAKILINRISIENKLKRNLTQKSYLNLAQRNAEIRLNEAKRNLISDFNESEVTQEILAGPTLENSKFLDRGNLVSFLGLENPEQSIALIRNKLETQIKLDNSPNFIQTKTGLIYEFRVETPSLQEIYDSAPSSWSSASWIELVQRGVNNFLAFIYFRFYKPVSRSGHGLQNSRAKSKGGKVLGIPYVKEMIDRFKERFGRR